jgi:hypothetical protein
MHTQTNTYCKALIFLFRKIRIRIRERTMYKLTSISNNNSEYQISIFIISSTISYLNLNVELL